MGKFLSRKLRFISVFAMAAVIMIHSYNYADNFLTPTTRISEGFRFPPMLEYFFSNGICRFAVPLFFMISGFLFFYNYKNSVDGYLTKIKKRAYSLLVPYVIWALLSGLLVTILSQFAFFGELPIISQRAVSWGEFYKYLINPPAFQLWYIQQLLIFVVLAPLIYALVKYTRGFILILFGGLWAADINYIINSTGLFFFSLGATFAIFFKWKNITRKGHRIHTIVFTTIWIGISLIYTIIAATTKKGDTFIDVVMLLMSKLNEVIGVVAMWLLFDHIAKRITDKKGFLIASTHLFFVYAMHEPLLHIFYQIGLKQEAGVLGHLGLYIGLPLSVGAVCIIVSMAMRKNLRKVHRFFVGGRW